MVCPVATPNVAWITAEICVPIDLSSGLFINQAGQLAIDCIKLREVCELHDQSGCPPVGGPVGTVGSCVVSWNISSTNIIVGQQVTANFNGLPANANFTVVITLPNLTTFNWNLQANPAGAATGTISLNSGVGIYRFTPTIAGCTITPQFINVTVAAAVGSPVGSPPNCNQENIGIVGLSGTICGFRTICLVGGNTLTLQLNGTPSETLSLIHI